MTTAKAYEKRSVGLMRMDGWTGFRPLLCTVKAELGRGHPGLMRWSRDETLPQSSIDRSALDSAAHCATSEHSGRPRFYEKITVTMSESHLNHTMQYWTGSNEHQWPCSATIKVNGSIRLVPHGKKNSEWSSKNLRQSSIFTKLEFSDFQGFYMDF